MSENRLTQKRTKRGRRPPARRSRSGDAPVRLGTGEVLHATEAAVLVRLGGKSVWLPRAGLHAESRVPAESRGEVVVSAWLARKRGWL